MNRWLSYMLVVLTAVVVGCEDYDDDKSTRGGRTYLPAAGMGAILVENDSFSDWNVDIDSVQVGRVASGSFLVRDATPGRHLIHLDVHQGSEVEDRAIDVEEGLLSVVRIDGDSFDYDVALFTIVP